MDDHVLLHGRPHGGCAIIYNNRLQCSVTPVSVDSKRCMAAIVTVNSCSLLLINVYMPCDQQTLHRDVMYDEVLNNINQIIHSHDHVNQVVIGGDLNTDMARLHSSHSSALREFCDHEDLYMCIDHNNSNIDRFNINY